MRVINKNLFVWPVDTYIKSLQTTLFSDLWFPTNWCFPPQVRYVVVRRRPRFGDMRTWRHRDERGVEPPQVNWWLLKISVNPYKMRPAPRGPRVDNYLRQKSPEIPIIAAGIWVWPLKIRHQPHHSRGEPRWGAGVFKWRETQVDRYLKDVLCVIIKKIAKRML